MEHEDLRFAHPVSQDDQFAGKIGKGRGGVQENLRCLARSVWQVKHHPTSALNAILIFLALFGIYYSYRMFFHGVLPDTDFVAGEKT